ncbi:MAG: hypothetical protein N3B21_09910, partial [Clostridia bacterium]|nr:hypothetical protein [Clostridia bacterium]
IVVANLAEGDIVKVYSAATAGTVLGTATVATGETSVSISVAQLGTAAGSVYVSVKATDKLESARTTKAYIAEPVTTAPVAAAITVTNNATGTPDTVAVTGLAEGDVVKVYSAATAGTVLGTATVATGETSVNITITQLGTAAGSVYVSIEATDKNESTRTTKAYIAEPVSTAPVAANITVTNNKLGTNDTVVVTGLAEGDVVKVYSAATAGTVLGTATVASGETSVNITITQIAATAGNVYVSVTSTSKNESARTAKAYDSETSAALLATAITVTNNYVGTNDTVVVTGLAEGDVVKVYSAATAGTVLGTATVATGETSATVSIAQLGSTGGTVYVSVTKVNKLESTRTSKTFVTEPVTTAPVAANITVTNSATGTNDSIVVTGLAEGDIVKVYSAATAGTVLGTATVATGETSVSISVAQLGTAAGSVYVSVKATDKLESARTTKAYIAEPVTTAPVAANIAVTNNKVGINDEVVVTGLAEGDVVKVYSAATAGTVLGTATVATGETSVTISVAQLSPTAGSAYVSVTATGKNESARTAKAYTSETSAAPTAASITITNNTVGTPDNVSVTGLAAGDVVKVYNVSTGGTEIASGTVDVGQTVVHIAIEQIGTTAGNLYITITKPNKIESTRTAKAYLAE